MKPPAPASPPRSWESERRHFIEAGGNSTHAFGLGRMIGRVYALLYLTPEPLSLEQVADALKVSKASASITLRQLESWQAVLLINVEGDRRDFYVAQTDFSILLRKGIMPGVRKKLRSAGVQIERTLVTTTSDASASTTAASSSSNGDSTPAKFNREQMTELKRRLKAAQSFHKRVDGILGSKLLSRFL
jgi:DNA-binding transcriptional regulator GbsR (MarR family)